MIPAPGIEDQELAVGAERSRIYDGAVARRRHLGGRAGRDRQALLTAAESVGGAEVAAQGIDYFNNPQTRSLVFTLGINR